MSGRAEQPVVLVWYAGVEDRLADADIIDDVLGLLGECRRSFRIDGEIETLEILVFQIGQTHAGLLCLNRGRKQHAGEYRSQEDGARCGLRRKKVRRVRGDSGAPGGRGVMRRPPMHKAEDSVSTQTAPRPTGPGRSLWSIRLVHGSWCQLSASMIVEIPMPAPMH